MSTLHDITLVEVSVDVSATFADAARALSESRLSALAVVDDGKVVGLFTDEELLLGIVPGYLRELKHTAFLEAELPSLREHAVEVQGEPVRKHMRKPVTIELEGSSMHAAERFVHREEGALPVVDADDRYVGMLSRTEFAHALLKRLAAAAG